MATSTRTYKRKRGINTDDINRDTNSLNVASSSSNPYQNAAKNFIDNNGVSPIANITKRRRGPRARNHNISTASNNSFDTSSNTASNVSSNGQEQVLNDEEYAKNLQRQFDESFLNMQEIERKDRTLAAKLEREERQIIENNVQQNFQPILTNIPLPVYQNYLQPNTVLTQMHPSFQPVSMQQNEVMNWNQRPDVSSQQNNSTATASNNTIPHQHPIKHNRGRSRVVNTNTNTNTTTATTPTTSTLSHGLNMNQQLRQPTNVFEVSRNQINNQTSATNYNNVNSNQQTQLLINNGNSVLIVEDKYSILPTYECTKQINDNENECTICFEEYSIGCKITHLACVHKFHESCIKKWLTIKNADECPICNKYAFAFST